MGEKSGLFKITIPKEVAFLQLPCAVLFLMSEARFRVEVCTVETAGGGATEFSICKLT